MSTKIHSVCAELAHLDWIVGGEQLAQLSQDFNWYSPVLKAELADKRAQAVVRPRTETEIRQVVSACAKADIPITTRGAGTGNYGQCVPLHGGVVLDMSQYNAFLWARNGVGRAQSGIRCSDFDHAARSSGWELRCMPSTFRTATIGGLFGGGFGGIGSINYGPLAAGGNVLGIRAMTIEPEPKSFELRGADAMAMHHVWGTNGLVLEVELGLAPAYQWMDLITVFDDFDQAMKFANAVASAPGLVKKNISLMGAPTPEYLTPLAESLPDGCHAVLGIVAEHSEPAFNDYVSRFGGVVTYRQTAQQIEQSKRTLAEFNWNHTTLHAMNVDSNLTYLQVLFTAGEHLEQMQTLYRKFGEEVMFHAQFIRNADGIMTSSALPLVKYISAQRLQEISQILREHGMQVDDAHSYRLQVGFHLESDDGVRRGKRQLPRELLSTKQLFDPKGLLNPGKLVEAKT